MRRTTAPPHDSIPVVPQVRPGFDCQPFLPTSIRHHLAAGGGEPEHRMTTVAFIHFDGTDEIYEHEGPAAVADALDELVTDVQQAVDERDVTFLGTDVDHDGGKIILVAGAPRALPRDEDRLLATLHSIMSRKRRLQVRAGAHRGSVFAGDVGPVYRRTYTVMGDTVNLSARLMARAEPGQVITTPAVLDRSTTSWSTTALPPFLVKGKRQPIEAFVLGAPERRAASAAPSLPLVGRDEEIAVFDAQIAAVRDGAGRLVQIVGEAGIGKSRLAEELRLRAAEHMPHFAIGCDPYEATTPYAAFWWLLHDLLGVAPHAPVDEVINALERRVARGRSEPPAVAPAARDAARHRHARHTRDREALARVQARARERGHRDVDRQADADTRARRGRRRALDGLGVAVGPRGRSSTASPTAPRSCA